MATRTLTVNLIGRTDKLDRSFKNASRGADTMAGKLMKATRMAGIGFGALAGVAIGAAAALKPMIDKAASMEESLSKNRVVFGESSKAIEAFAETSLHSFGVTERAALEATGVIGTLGTAMGMTASDSAEMATTLVGLAGDMSSFNDASVEETLTAIQAGLRGEAEPLRRFGVLLDAATLKAKALEQGIITSTKDALTPQQKALAAYAVILEQTSIQMGDFTRTADSATNQSKLLAGEWDKIQTEIGTALLPAFTSIVTHLNESVLPAVRQFWSDPSWHAGGVLAGKAAGSGFVTGITDAVGGLSPEETKDLGWRDSWKASAELRFLAAGVSAAREFIRGVNDELDDNDPFDPETIAGRGRRAAGRPEEAAGGSATNITNIVSHLENLAADVEAAAAAAKADIATEPFPGLSQAEIDAIESNAVAAAVEAALAAVPVPVAVAPVGGGLVVPAGDMGAGPLMGAGAAGAAGGGAAAGPTDAEILKWLGTSGAQQMIGQGPPNVTIIAPAVSGQEVVDAIGKYVDGNGPLPPHWQQGAN